MHRPERGRRAGPGARARGRRRRQALRAAGDPRDRPARRLRPRGRARAARRRRARQRHHRHAAALPQRDRPPPAADARRGDRARQAHRARRPRRQGPDDQRQPAAGRLDRQEVPGLRADAARPDPGGHPRPDPRRREVRLAPRLPLLDLRDLVDPPGGRARDGRQGPHHQAADQPRAQPAQGRARGERCWPPSSTGRRPTPRSPPRRSSRSRSCTRCATPRAR